MKGKSPMMKALIGKQNNLPAELKAKIEASPAKMKKASPAKEVTKSGKINPFSAEYKSMTKSQRTKKYGDKKLQGSDKRQIGGPEGRLDLELKHQLESGMFAKIKKAAGNVSRVIKGENKDGTSKGGLVIKSKKDETTGKRSTTITRKNNTDKKLSKNNTNTNTNTNSNTKTKKGFDYSNATSVNALVKVRNKWERENPGIKFPGQSEINKRLKKNPGVYN